MESPLEVPVLLSTLGARPRPWQNKRIAFAALSGASRRTLPTSVNLTKLADFADEGLCLTFGENSPARVRTSQLNLSFFMESVSERFMKESRSSARFLIDK